jgi:hypothetical protein
MTDRRRGLAPFWVLLIFGILNVLRLFTNPRLGTYYGPDVVQFVGTGLLLGAAIGLFVASMLGRRPS